MRKTTIMFLALALAVAMTPNKKADAIDQSRMDGDPMSNANHFVWDLMEAMDTPDDTADCQTAAVTLLTADGFEGDPADVASMACGSLAEMRTNMESGMDGAENESMETNLFDATDWHTVQDLYFQHSTGGVADGRIAFSVPIDFMSYNFMSFMMSFGQNMETSQGRISLDADVVGGFANYGATLTMYNVPDFENPKILVNGGEDTGGVVSNLAYDRTARTLTFSAAHFTEFEAVEGAGSGDTKPKIYNVKIEKYRSRTGDARIKVTLSGNHFKKSTRVTLGGKKAFRVALKSRKKIVAFFSADKLESLGKTDLKLKAKNGNKTKQFKKSIPLADLL